jgi:hypothetical protein
MKTLRHRVTASNLDDAAFNSLVAAFDQSGGAPLSSLLGKPLSKKLDIEFTYQPIDTQSSNYGFTAPGKSEVVLMEQGILVLELATTSRTQGTGILGLLSIGDSGLNVTVFGATYYAANRLLSIACRIVYQFLSTQPPHEEMFDENFSYFIVRAHDEGRKFLEELKQGATFADATYDDSDLALSTAMAERPIREFIIRIVRAHNLPEPKFAEEILALENGPAIESILTDGSFVQQETFIECKKTSQPLARFQGDHADLVSLGLQCGNCNRLYQDEKIYQAYVCTEKLRELVRSSRWMSVLVSSYLVELGVPCEFIFWNVAFGGDELDVVAFVDGLPWVFELKDTEFSSSDAHHFNYRRSIIKPIEAFVISTSFISPDARRIFDDVSGEKPFETIATSGSKLPMPTFIEGLERVKESIESRVVAQGNATLRWKIRNAISGINSNITDIIAKKFDALR